MEMFTWEYLSSAAGATAAVTIITQFVKDFPIIKKLPSQFTSYIVTIAVMFLASFFTGTLTPSYAALVPINSIIIMLAANGTYNTISKKSTTTSEQ